MFGLPDTSVSEAVKAQLDAQISFFTHMSNQILEGMQRMCSLNTQAAKAMLDQSFAGTTRYLDAGSGIDSGREPSQNVAPQTEANIAKIVDTVIPPSAAEASLSETAQKTGEDVAKAAEQQNEVLEKVAAGMNPTPDRGTGKSGLKPVG
jgi:hypothetical protein